MRFGGLAGSALIVAGVIGAAAALGNEGRGGLSTPSVTAASERPPHTGCGEVPRGDSVHPKRGRDLILGPVAFYKAVNRNGEVVANSDEFDREPGQRYTGFKTPAILKRGTVATVVVPRSERPKLKLDFALGHPAGFASKLEACDDMRTGFPGGFSIRGPLCTKLRARIQGRETPITKPVSFGAGDCSSE